jgi:hypothetical protein
MNGLSGILINITAKEIHALSMKAVLFLVIISLPLFAEAQRNTTLPCNWHAGEKIADSDYHPIDKSNISCSLSNDAEWFYIDLKFSDPEILSLIDNSGLIFWVDMDEKSSKKLGVKYSVKAQTGTQSNSAGIIDLIGFVTEQERHFASDNFDNFRVTRKNANNGTQYLEMIMPLAKLPVRNSKDGRGAMPFSIGIEYGINSSSTNPEKVKTYWIKHISLAVSE